MKQALNGFILALELFGVYHYSSQGRWGYAMFYAFCSCFVAACIAVIATVDYMEAH